jgi:uncharacterized protein (TIRG00374 family)
VRFPRTLRRVLLILALLLVVEYLVFPQIAGVRKSLSLLGSANVLLIAAGIVLEGGAIAAYVQLTRSVVPREPGLGFFTALRIDLSTLAASHIVPGGGAVGTGIGYRLLTAAGIAGTDAGFALGTQGLGSAIVLNALFWVALVVSIPLHGFNPLYGSAAIVGAVLIGGFGALVLLLTRGEARAARVLRGIARRMPFLDEDRVHRLVHRLAARLRAMVADRRLLVGAIAWAAANWILDAASLWCFVAAFGYRHIGPDELLVSYGLANVLAAIPITPGGLGVVEAVLSSTLVGFGAPRGVAILGVIGYRLVNFWLPIPVGGAAYLSLKAAPRTRRTEELRREAERELQRQQTAREWAIEHGIQVRSGKAAGAESGD